MHLRRRPCFAYVIERLSPLLESIGCFGFEENLSTLSSLTQAHDPRRVKWPSGWQADGGGQSSPHGPAWQRGRRERGRVSRYFARSIPKTNPSFVSKHRGASADSPRRTQNSGIRAQSRVASFFVPFHLTLKLRFCFPSMPILCVSISQNLLC